MSECEHKEWTYLVGIFGCKLERKCNECGERQKRWICKIPREQFKGLTTAEIFERGRKTHHL